MNIIKLFANPVIAVKSSPLHRELMVFLTIVLTWLPLIDFAQAPDSPCLIPYRQAADLIRAHEYDSAYALTVEAAACFEQATDTLGWCKALDLQALASPLFPERAVKALDRAISIYDTFRGDTSIVSFRLRGDRIQAYINSGDYAKAIEFSNSLDGMRERLIEVDVEKGVGAIFLNMQQRGQMFNLAGMLSTAQHLYPRALKLIEGREGLVETRILAAAHSELSKIYRQMDDLANAAMENRVAVRLMESIPVHNAQTYGALLTYRADYPLILEDKGDLQAALDTLHVLLAAKKRMGTLFEEETGSETSNLGHVHLSLGNLDSALYWTTAARRIYERAGDNAVELTGKMDMNLSAIANRRGDYPEAIRLARRSISILNAANRFRGGTIAVAWKELATAYLSAGELDSAEVACGNSLIASLGDSVRINDPLRARNEQIVAPKQFMRALLTLGRVYERKFEQSCLIRHQIKALDTYTCAALRLQALNKYLRALDFLIYTDQSRLLFGESHYRWERLWRDNYPSIEGAIRLSLALYEETGEQQYLWKAWGISDMCKGRQIGKTAIFLGNETTDWIPKDWVEREEKLITALHLARSFSGRIPASDAKIPLLEQEFGLFKDSLRQLYPRYYEYHYESAGDSFRVARALDAPVAADRLVLEYFVGKDRIYVFLRGPRGLQYAEIQDVAGTEALVDSFRQVMAEAETISDETLAGIGMALSRRLFPFRLKDADCKRMLIIPDGFLFNVPFHALVRHDLGWLPGQDDPIPYWTGSVAIGMDFSYSAYCMSMQRARKMPPVTQAHQFVSRVSFRRGAETFFPTSITTSSMDTLAESVGLETTLDTVATRLGIAAALLQPAVVMVIAHGFPPLPSNGGGGFVALDDGDGNVDSTYASELLTMPKLENRMFILNSCQAASGNYLAGEGALSSLRAARQVGCPAVLSNLWDAREFANDRILTHMLGGLTDGLPLDIALQRAQIAAIQGAEPSLARHPIGWAALCLYGADEPIQFQSSSTGTGAIYGFLVVAGALILVLGFGGYKQSGNYFGPRE